MGRLTETLRSDEVTRGRAYELQGSEACGGMSPAGVTNVVDKVHLSGTDGTQKEGSGVSPGALKSRVGAESI